MQELFSNNLKKVRAQAMGTKKPGYRSSRAVALGADNGARTRDPHLGKVVLYQLSHVRVRGDTIHKLLAQAKQNRKTFSRLGLGQAIRPLAQAPRA